MVKLVFNLTALEYASNLNLVGQRMLDILLCPSNSQVTERFYGAMMMLWESLETFAVPINGPSTPPKSGESFCDYFCRIVQEDYVKAMNDDRETKNDNAKNCKKNDHAQSKPKRDVRFKRRFEEIFWIMSDVRGQGTFDINLVLNSVQRSKCFILLNIAVRHFFTTCFWPREMNTNEFLRDLFWNAVNLETMFTIPWIEDIVFDINMAAYYVPAIEYDWISKFDENDTLRNFIRREAFPFAPKPDERRRNLYLLRRIKYFIHNSVQTLQGKITPLPHVAQESSTFESNHKSTVGRRAKVRNVSAGPNFQLAINQMIFKHNGSFRPDLRGAIDFGKKQGLIVLDQDSDCSWRNDYRFFFPIMVDDSKHSLYRRIESLLQAFGLIDSEKERLDDVGVIKAGSVNQYIHIDFVESDASVKAVKKRDYETAMNGPNSPASILIGLGCVDGSSGTRLAVLAKDVKCMKKNDK